MGPQDLRDPLALGALTDKSYRVPPLFEPLITNGVVEQDAHEIAYFCLGGVRQAFSIDSTQLLKPAFYGDSSDIPDAHTTPVRSLWRNSLYTIRVAWECQSTSSESSVSIMVDQISD